MDLNSIQLTPALVAGLYENALVETDSNPTGAKPAFPFLGNNQKNILVVTANPDVAFLTENELAFLSNVLAACKLSIADAAVINKEKIPQIDYIQAIDFFHSTSVLLFGVDPVTFGLPIHFPPFQLQRFGGPTYLFAPPLEEIEKDKGLKSKLWMSLKTLFGL